MNSPHVIDERLSAIGKDRAWLSANTPYSPDYIRTVLAPNSKRRTDRVMKVLMNAIEAEERKQADAKDEKPIPLDRLTITVTPSTFEAWSQAAAKEGKTIKEWAISTINNAAENWHRSLKVAETPNDYNQPPPPPGSP